MDSKRAKEIIDSPEKIEVLYQDTPVWIQNVKDNNVAEVTRPGGDGEKMEIPVYLLVENRPARKN